MERFSARQPIMLEMQRDLVLRAQPARRLGHPRGPGWHGVATIAVSGPIEGGDIAVGGGSVWVQPGGDLLVRVHPATNAVVATYGPRSGSGSVVANDAAVWVWAHDTESIWRLPLP